MFGQILIPNAVIMTLCDLTSVSKHLVFIKTDMYRQDWTINLLIIYLLLQINIIFVTTANEEIQLPRCKHISPYKELVSYCYVVFSIYNFIFKKKLYMYQERELWKFGTTNFAFDMLASDRLGPIRNIGNQAHHLCQNTTFHGSFPTSIVIIHHNEALSTLLRMIIGIIDRTPPELLHELIIYEDASDDEHRLTEHLQRFVKTNTSNTNIIIIRSDERQGLIRAKTLASRQATGEVIVFLDSHCEVSDRWLEPLLAPIMENPNSIVLPIVDLIHPLTFEYSKAMIAKSGFDWALSFKWIYLPWEYFDVVENNIRPFESPSMSGGLLAVRRKFFQDLGEYDIGMEIWGGENVELSLKAWMCGGRVVVAPCSRIGHVFRIRRPYKSKPGLDTNLYNSIRVAKTWLGKYEKYFMQARPAAQKMDYGDISTGLKLKEKLKCKDMQWFLENIYPDLIPEKNNRKDEL
uniref:Glyco_trans_2-like domain-containing protein n=1 Tax=Heterorhabditis bacteriophora TaxID=37862 RepID=A0A1I7XSB1_HETBA